jgi:large subunit ribosomal protein L9
VKVILKEEVDNLGLPGDVVDVAAGYGRNYLIPRGLAIKATKGALREAETLTRARKAHEAKTLGSAQEFKEILESRKLRVPARVDEKGTLYGSVGTSEIHEVLKQRGHDIERRRIELHRPVKSIGEYSVVVHVHPQVAAEVTVEVVDAAGEVTIEGLEAERAAARAETEESLEERAIAAAEEVEAEEAAAEADAEVDAAEPTDEDRAESEAGEPEASEPEAAELESEDAGGSDDIEDALAARATAPADVDAPTTPEELVAEAEDDAEESAT